MAGLMGLSQLSNINIQTESRPGVRLGQMAKTAGPSGTQKSFSEFLEAQVQDVNSAQVEADKSVAAMATGRSHNIHEMMIALDRADVSFRLATKVRNKAVEAYQEIMRMQF
jgi:flagellar hook-basal body complex protein FliE